MNKLKIIFITKEFEDVRSGMGRYSNGLIKELSRMGHQITVICPREKREVVNQRIKNIDIKYTFRLPVQLGHANWILNSYLLSSQLEKTLKDKNFDLIHFIEARDALFFKKSTIPTIGTVHDYLFANASLNLSYYKKTYPYDWLTRILYYNIGHFLEKRVTKKVDHLIAPSKALAEYLRQKYQISSGKVSVVNNGMVLKCSYPKNNLIRKRIVLFVGNNFQHKGLVTLIKASRIIVKELKNVDFAVVGRDQRSKNEIIKLCNTEKVTKFFRFQGHLEDKEICKLYQSSTVLAYPTLVDNFPSVVLEAQAAGLPSVTTPIGGVKEIVTHKKNGFLIKPGDYQDLAKYILILFKNKNIWKKISKTSQDTARKFTVENMARNTAKIYKELVS